jgi:hypothetical protein
MDVWMGQTTVDHTIYRTASLPQHILTLFPVSILHFAVIMSSSTQRGSLSADAEVQSADGGQYRVLLECVHH